jgi:hypothetical protein
LPEACFVGGCTCGQCQHCHHAAHLPTAVCGEPGCNCPETYLLEASAIAPAVVRVGASATATLDFWRRKNIPFSDGTTGSYTCAWSLQIRHKPLQADAWQTATAGNYTATIVHVQTQGIVPIIYNQESLIFTPSQPGYWEISAIATTTRFPNAPDGTILSTTHTVKTWTVTAWDFAMDVGDPSLGVYLSPAQALQPGAMAAMGGEMIGINLVCAPADFLQGQLTLTRTAGIDLRIWTPAGRAATPPVPLAEWSGTAAQMLYVDATSPGTATLRATFTPAGAGATPLTADAKVTIVKLDISPNSGPLGTKVTVKMIPAGLNLFSADSTVSGTGKFTSAAGASTNLITVSHPKEKLYFNPAVPDEIGLVIGEVWPSLSLADGWLVSRASGGTCNGTVEATASGRKFSAPFTFTPSDHLCLGRITVDENGVESFTAITTFSGGDSLYVQALVKIEAGVIPPATIAVKVQSLDADDNPVAPPAGCAATSQTLTLQKVGENGNSHVYRSDAAMPIVPWNGGVTLEMAEGAFWLYYVDNGSLEVKYEDQ